MITHYGLFWSAADVYWGRRGRDGEGALLGKVGAKGKEEDFREYIGIYALYDNDQLLYVGETGITGGKGSGIFFRLRQHLGDKDPVAGRWRKFSWFGCENPGGKGDAKTFLAQLEAVAIAISSPHYNRQSGSFAGADRVFQVAHEEAEGDVITKLDRLQKTIGDLRSNS